MDQALKGFLLIPTDHVDVFDVVGTFELLLMAKELAESGQYHAIAYTAFVVDRGIF